MGSEFKGNVTARLGTGSQAHEKWGSGGYMRPQGEKVREKEQGLDSRV